MIEKVHVYQKANYYFIQPAIAGLYYLGYPDYRVEILYLLMDYISICRIWQIRHFRQIVFRLSLNLLFIIQQQTVYVSICLTEQIRIQYFHPGVDLQISPPWQKIRDGELG